MGVRGTDTGRRPMLKTIGIFSGAGQEGRHLLGQSLRSANPLFAAPFGFPSPRGYGLIFGTATHRGVVRELTVRDRKLPSIHVDGSALVQPV